MSWLDLLIIILIGLGLIKGLFDGVIKQVISFLSLIFAIFFTGKGVALIRKHIFLSLNSVEDIPEYILIPVCYLLTFSLISGGFWFVGKMIHKTIKKTPLSSFNSLLGGLLGGAQVLLLLSLMFNLMNVLDRDSRIVNKQIKEDSVLFTKVKAVIPELYPHVKEYIKDRKVFDFDRKMT
jgi:Uncharacterized membrane protein, required for colicin V production